MCLYNDICKYPLRVGKGHILTFWRKPSLAVLHSLLSSTAILNHIMIQLTEGWSGNCTYLALLAVPLSCDICFPKSVAGIIMGPYFLGPSQKINQYFKIAEKL